MIVQVYFNIRKRLWSVRSKETRKVVLRSTHVVLFSPRFYVSEAGRQRVIREQRKNVHAWVEGEFVEAYDHAIADLRRAMRHETLAVSYNPYKNETFVYMGSREPIQSADFVHMSITKYRRPSVRVSK